MNQLEPCPHCHRHVAVSESACPFCAGSLAGAFADRVRTRPSMRLGRAATFAFGAFALTQGACEHGSSPPDAAVAPTDVGLGHNDGTPSDADEGGTPIYAAAPTPDGGSTPTRG